MDIFGKSWENYVPRIDEEWRKMIKEDDLVILPGDFSWATYLEQSKKDFEFLNALPGKKILLKGNHDYWWSTLNKMRNFLKDNDFKNIDFLQNGCVMYENIALCGSRGWSYIGYKEPKTKEDLTIYEREALFHIGLMRIHPFEDGNKRTAKIIMNANFFKKNYKS